MAWPPKRQKLRVAHFHYFSSTQSEAKRSGARPGDVTSAVALGVFGEAADHSLHRLLQHRRVPGVTVAGGPRPQAGSDAAVQAVELQRRRRRRRPGRGGQGGRGGKQRRDGHRHPGPEGRAEGPGRTQTEPDARL